jgi:hypothetical protein
VSKVVRVNVMLELAPDIATIKPPPVVLVWQLVKVVSVNETVEEGTFE